jgi:fructooligosaccharide transport system substrate-binding protein
MKMRLWTMVIALLVMGSLVLAACQSAAPAAEPAAPAPEQPAAAEPAAETTDPGTADRAPVTLTFIKIADELEAQAHEEILAQFHQIEDGRWSHVTIQFDAKPFAELFRAIETAVATGAGVDLIQADGPDVKHFAHNGVLMPLTEYFSDEEMANYSPQSIEEGTWNGDFFGPPQNQSCQLMWYNQDMLDAAGITLGEEGLTYGPEGTALPVWQRLTRDEDGDGTPEVYGMQVAGPAWYDYLNRIAARTNGVPGDPTYEGVSEDGLGFVGYFDTPEAIEAYQFDQDLIHTYRVRSQEPPANAMLAGFSASSVQQDMVLGTLQDQFPDFNIAATAPPYWQTPMCHTGSWHYSIASNTDNFEEALAYIKFAASLEGQQIMYRYKGQMPGHLGLLNTLPEYNDGPRRLVREFFLEYGEPRITSPAYTEYNALFTEFYQALVAGGDVEELTREYAEFMEQAAARYRD